MNSSTDIDARIRAGLIPRYQWARMGQVLVARATLGATCVEWYHHGPAGGTVAMSVQDRAVSLRVDYTAAQGIDYADAVWGDMLWQAASTNTPSIAAAAYDLCIGGLIP